MRQYLLSIFLATAVMSTGCSKPEREDHATETPDAASGGTVRFLAGVSGREDDWNVRSTRGVPIDNTTIHQFAAYCFQTGRKQWADTMAFARPNKMCDVPVMRNGNEWIYDLPVKWEGGDGSYFTFFGYSPRATGVYDQTDSPLGNNLELTTKATDPGVPNLKYTTLDDVSTQVDLLVAAPVYNTFPVEKVQMKFSHALSQIRFMAWSATDLVRVKRIEISNVQYSATLTLAGMLAPLSGVKTFTLDEINRILSTDQTKMTDLSDGTNAFMLLPQDLSSNTTAKIVVTYIANGQEKQSTPYTINQKWEKGKSYIYTIKLSGISTEEMLITDVMIKDWIVEGSEDINTGGGTAEQI